MLVLRHSFYTDSVILATDLNYPLTFAKYFRVYLYGDHTEDFPVKFYLIQDPDNYLFAEFTAKAQRWIRLESQTKTWQKVGNPQTVNTISVETPNPLLIDSDFMLLPLLREPIKLRFSLNRPSQASQSPTVKLVKVVWREGDFG